MQSTFEEGEAPATAVHLLIPAVCYDDLGAAPAPVRVLDGSLIVGRAEPGFDDGFMSSRHARIVVEHGRARVEDLESKNGVFLSGQRISRADLVDGDSLEVGHTLFVYRRTSPRTSLRVQRGDAGIGPTPSRCPRVVELAERVALIARAAEPVLVLGPAASGKSTLAARLAAPGRPCVTYDGTTTLAQAIDAAEGGTLIVEELAHLTPALQDELLQRLERAQSRARLVVTSHRDPFASDARVRPDLLHRLAAFVLEVPPLSARREDLGLLAAETVRPLGRQPVALTVRAARALLASPLPGNLRQLSSALTGAVRLAEGAPIELVHLPAWITEPSPALPPSEPSALATPPAVLTTPASPPAPAGGRAHQATPPQLHIAREGKLFHLQLGAHEARVADVQGLHFLEALVTTPEQELHVLDLVRGEGAIDTGDHGEVLDAAAIKAYKRRLAELRTQLEEAEAQGQHAVALAAREEHEALVDELSRGTGLGGKARRTGRPVERARVNVAMRIRTAIGKIAEVCPPIARHLEAHVKTGVQCVYRPPQ